MKTLIALSVAVLVGLGVLLVGTEEARCDSDSPCSDAMANAFAAADLALYAGFLGDRSLIASDFHDETEQCEEDYATQEEIAQCKTLVRSRARNRFNQAVTDYEEGMERACSDFDPDQCWPPEIPVYSSLFRKRCEYGIIQGLPAHNPY